MRRTTDRLDYPNLGIFPYRLAKREGGDPKQATLRRAASTA
jgi:hypothetical protein